ncbi:MAG: T9SS type A sorting domain-containing protein [Bacteroidetes bacterium]|nr:T9SS type A sorting domain-containing protein [Bacteroidota bacterium]
MSNNPKSSYDLIFITGQDEIITIVNLFGQTVRQITNAKSESCINVADLDEGMYLLKAIIQLNVC